MAERVFEDILTIVSDEAINKNLQIAEKKAFLYSFLLLKDFGKPVVKKLDKKKNKKEQAQLNPWEKYQENYRKI